jgi:hypothetical protein
MEGSGDAGTGGMEGGGDDGTGGYHHRAERRRARAALCGQMRAGRTSVSSPSAHPSRPCAVQP